MRTIKNLINKLRATQRTVFKTMSFKNKVVLVTGGSSGIGATTAIHFAKEGAHVAIVGRNEDKLNNVAAQIAKFGKKPLVIKADVVTEDSKTIIKKTIVTFGKLDVLVNNAGITRRAKLDDENFVDAFDLVMNNNLRSNACITNQAIPYLAKTKGNIVNVSSIAGEATLNKLTPEGNSPYCVSKAAINHFSKYCAMELAPKGIRVNVVSPGPAETSFLENNGVNVNWDAIKDMTALKALAKTEEVAELILYLASDKARCITGSNYFIDSGFLVN